MIALLLILAAVVGVMAAVAYISRDNLCEVPPQRNGRPERRFVDGWGCLWQHNNHMLRCALCGREIKHFQVPWYRGMHDSEPIYTHPYCYSNCHTDAARRRLAGVF